MTSTHLAAIHIPLSAYPTAAFHRPVNHKSVKCFSDIISRPGVGRENCRENGGGVAGREGEGMVSPISHRKWDCLKICMAV